MATKADLLPADAVARIRYPQQIFTSAYLDDPIEFEPDERLNAESLTREVTDLTLVTRENAEYLEINLNDKETKFFPISMFRQRLNRFDYEAVVDRKFKHF